MRYMEDMDDLSSYIIEFLEAGDPDTARLFLLGVLDSQGEVDVEALFATIILNINSLAKHQEYIGRVFSGMECDKTNLGRYIYAAIDTGDTLPLRMLLDAGAGTDGHVTYSGMPPLAYAVSHGMYEAAELLLRYGARVDGVTPIAGERQAAIHIAVMNDDEAAVGLLLRYGANPYVIDDYYKKTAVDLSVGKKVGRLFE